LFRLVFASENKLSLNINKRAQFSFSLWAGSSQPNRIHVQNYGSEVKINNHLNFKMVERLNKTTHFTCVVNGKRLRVYVDNEKVLDLPSLLQEGAGRYVQFYLNGTNKDLNHI